jgi:hypothetical protein
VVELPVFVCDITDELVIIELKDEELLTEEDTEELF